MKHRPAQSRTAIMSSIVFFCLFFGHACASKYDLSETSLKKFPTKIPSGTTELLLATNILYAVDETALQGLLLTTISLKENEFTQFPNLTSLGATLLEIQLSSNQISVVPAELLQGFVLLTHLYLADNLLSTFPPVAGVGSTLTTLDLAENQLTTVTFEDIKPLKVITNLGIGGNPGLTDIQISALADTLNIVKLQKLRALNDTYLEHFFTPFIHLTMLDIRVSNTAVFPDLSHSCTNLTMIRASVNKIKSIPPAYIAMCRSVESLDIVRNSFTSFPDLRAMQHSLQHLYLSKNLIKEIDPKILQTLSSLIKVQLSNNQILTFPDFTSSAASLQILNLGFNRISQVKRSLVEGLVTLTILNLENNALTAIPELFAPSLVELNLGGNDIAGGSAWAMAGLSNLTHLDLSDCPLIQILPTLWPSKTFEISLGGCDQLRLCDPSLTWLKHPDITVLTGAHVFCNSLGKLWSEATFEELSPLPSGSSQMKPGDVKQMLLLGPLSTFCSWPLRSPPVPLSPPKCAELCMGTPGCYSFNYHMTKGLCLPVGPTGGGVPQEDTQGWQYFPSATLYLP